MSNRPDRGSKLYALMISMIAAVGGFIFGYDLNVISPAMLFITDEFQLSPFGDSFARSSALFACIIGPILAYIICDAIGRRACLIIAGILFAVSAIGTALPETMEQFNTFRILGGIGVGLASIVSPMYIAEVAPARLRGMLVTVNQLAIVIGSTIAISVCYFAAKIESWRLMFASELPPIVLFLIGLYFLPRSPRWLMQKGREEEALEALSRVDGKENAKKEIEEIREVITEETGTFRELFFPGVRMALLIAVGIAMFQQWCGTSPLMSYAPDIFRKAGFDSVEGAIRQTVFMHLFLLCCTLVAFALVDRVGRRPLLLFGTVGMAFSLILLGLLFHLQQTGVNVVIAMFLAQFAYEISLAPVGWVIISEIFPTKLRAKGQSIAVVLLWISAAISVLITGPMMTTMENRFGSPAGTFWVFSAVCIGAFVFTKFLVPETKGKSLEAIGKMWLHKPEETE